MAGFLPWVEETGARLLDSPAGADVVAQAADGLHKVAEWLLDNTDARPIADVVQDVVLGSASPPPSTTPRRPSRPPAPSPPQSPPPDPIQHRDRVFVTGASDTGKSVIARTIFETVTGHKGIIDPTDSELTDVPGAVVFRDPLAVDLTLHLWRFVPIDPEDRDAYDALYGRVNRLPGPFFIWDDECRFSCPSSGGAPGPRTYLATKRKRQMGWVGANTRPVGVYLECRNQAKHILSTMLFGNDRAELATTMSVPLATLDAAYAELATMGLGAFLWWHTRTRELQLCPPVDAPFLREPGRRRP